MINPANFIMATGSDDQPTAARASMPDAAWLAAARFTPGAILGDRYRMVSLLGAGGMGEVYRADDMKLGQRVALKCVPAELANDRKAFDRLCAEVRVARQVSHPNVCRVFDMVLVDGLYFISMEFVEGEDLRSLLRRIGRLAPDKALAVARDICSGLAAAHDRGVVHRDLKPANVMIDGRGTALIADFGLAVIAGECPDAHGIAGTPAYMAPEQMRGGEVTQRSDIYALGLILYEIFTGKQLFTGASLEQIREAHLHAKPRPTSIVREIEPDIERLILKCLDEDPALRPSSAHAVLAALPGGGALEAALAAGETPSPEMVAAAGITGELSAPAAWLLGAGAIVAVLLGAWASSLWTLSGMVPDTKPRDVLVERAREIARSFGYPKWRGESIAFATDRAYLKTIAVRRDARKWSQLATEGPSPVRFLRRSSPAALLAENVEGIVTADDPAETLDTMTTIQLDHHGRLRSFRAVPPERATGAAGAAFDWRLAFEQAGLDLASFTQVTPLWTPPYGFDHRMAWSGRYPGSSGIAVRVEAASLAGRPVFFRVVEPWTKPASIPGRPPLGYLAFGVVTFIAAVGGAVIARRNYRRGRGDLRGALRIGIVVFACRFLAAVFIADHVISFSDEWELLLRIFGISLTRAVTAVILYLAVEPYVRRQWPRMLIAWSRLVAGRKHDPLVGRDIMIGAIAAGATVVASRASVPVAAWLGNPNVIPLNTLARWEMRSPIAFLSTLVSSLSIAILTVFAVLTLLVVFALIVRRYAAAMFLTLALLSMAFTTGNVPLAANVVQLAVMLYVLHKFGALAYAAGESIRSMMFAAPFTLDLGAWYAPRAFVVLLVVGTLVAYGFHTSLAGKPLFSEPMPAQQPAP
jgi:serine/threonine-protein kinase